MILRHYQHQAVSNLRTAFRSGARAPLLVLPTGGGKTIILAAITHQALTRGARVLILVHRRELIHQTSAKLTAMQVPHGIIAAGVDRADAPIQVASVQTLIRRIDTAVSRISSSSMKHTTPPPAALGAKSWPIGLMPHASVLQPRRFALMVAA